MTVAKDKNCSRKGGTNGVARIVRNGRVLQLTALLAILVGVALPVIKLKTWESQQMLLWLVCWNCAGWALAAVLLWSFGKLRVLLGVSAKRLGISDPGEGLSRGLSRIFRDIQRKKMVLSLPMVSSRLGSNKELTQALNQLANYAYKLLEAETVELLLFDSQSDQCHMSVVLGIPFQSDSRALLGADKSELAENELFLPITFAGDLQGSLRVRLGRSACTTDSDWEIVDLLALQSALALMNSRYSEELMRMKRAVDESVKAKTGFLANLSHEVRAPLSTLINGVELMLEGLCGELNYDQHETLKLVERSSQHLLDLINDVLDYAKIEAGRVKPRPEAINISEMLGDVAAVIRSQARGKRIQVEVISPPQTMAVTCDRRHLRQMLINLATNSVKYTQEGGRVTLKATEAPGELARIHVVDNGIGIPNNEWERLFVPFERIDGGYAREQEGAGLGLALTKRLVELNSGEIGFSSEPGRGSDFWLELPYSLDGPNSASVSDESEEVVQGHGETLVILKDRPDESELFSRYLQKCGFKVLICSTLEEVSQIKTTPCLALIGERLLAQHGIKLIDNLRGVASGNSLPIIALTTRGFAFDVEEYLRLGVDLCLVKPVALKTVARVCRQFIDRQLRPIG